MVSVSVWFSVRIKLAIGLGLASELAFGLGRVRVRASYRVRVGHTNPTLGFGCNYGRFKDQD